MDPNSKAQAILTMVNAIIGGLNTLALTVFGGHAYQERKRKRTPDQEDTARARSHSLIEKIAEDVAATRTGVAVLESRVDAIYDHQGEVFRRLAAVETNASLALDRTSHQGPAK